MTRSPTRSRCVSRAPRSSTSAASRPGRGRRPVTTIEEQRRVIPIVRELASRGIPISIDTKNAVTALAAVEAGAEVINDVSGGLYDAAMGRVVAETGVTFVAMHWRGGADVEPQYIDVVSEVRSELRSRIAELIVAGVDPQQIILDPGLGFSKDAEHNWQLLSRLGELASLGHGILIGASRKRFLGDRCCRRAPPPMSATCRPPSSARSPRRPESGACASHDVRRHPGRPRRRHALGEREPGVNSFDRITLTGLRAFAHPRRVRARARRGSGLHHRRHACTWSSTTAAERRPGEAPCTTASSPSAVVAAVERDPVDLIETVAERVAAVALEFPAVQLVEVTVHKPNAPIDGAVRRRRASRSSAGADDAGDDARGRRRGRLRRQPRRPRGDDRAMRSASCRRPRHRGRRRSPRWSRRSRCAQTAPTRTRPATSTAIVLRAHEAAARRAARRCCTIVEHAHGTGAHGALGRPHARPRPRRATARSSSRPTGSRCPHPRAHERDFVLRPWLAVDPDAVLPGHGRVAELLAGLEGSA